MEMNNLIFSEIINEYKKFPEVEAIAIGGTTSSKRNDTLSDIDIYVFVSSDIEIEKRRSLVQKYSTKFEVGGEYFGSGDEYFVDKLEIQFDVMFWNINCFSQTIENVWINHYPSNGYTTCFLYTLDNFQILFEKNEYLTKLKHIIDTPYPEELKNNIIQRNMMLMYQKPFASYYEQIEKAIKRNDIISINHRISAFLASYFDVIFAINELLHPGEKRLINFAKCNCKRLPADFEKNIMDLLTFPSSRTLQILKIMIENLQNIIG